MFDAYGVFKGTVNTDSNGTFGFYNLPFGKYIVQETNPPGFPENSTPNQVIVDIPAPICDQPVYFADYVAVLGLSCPCPPWVLFNTDRDGNWEIYGADPYQPSSPSTTVERNLTNKPGNDREYSYTTVETRNGTEPRIAFQSDRDANWEIYTLKTRSPASRSTRRATAPTTRTRPGTRPARAI